MKRIRLLLIVGLLLCAVLFSLAAFCSPVKSFLPPYGPNIAAYEPLLPVHMSPFWVFVSYTEIAWGFVLVAILLLLCIPARRLLEAMPSIHKALTRPVALSRKAKLAALCVSVLSASAWGYYRYLFGLGLLFHEPPLAPMPLTSWVPYQYQALPVLCLVGIAALGLIAFRIERGLLSALKWTLKVFVLPVALLYTLCLWLSGSTEMVIYVTKFAYWSFGNIDYVDGWNGLYLLSNWTVLAVSASLFTAFVLEDFHPGVAR